MAVVLLLGGIVCTLQIILASGGTNCNDGRFYIREDPTSCSHFYKCDNGNPVRFPCPGNLYYNPNTHNCDWPYNVKCDVNQGTSQPNAKNGYPNNNGGQYNSNNGNNNGGQYNEYNGYTNNNGGQYNGNNGYPNNNEGQYNDNNGYPNNNGGQYNDNNGYPNNNGGQYNGYTNNDIGQYNSKQDDSYSSGQGQGFNNQQNDDEFFYPVQPVDAQDPEIGPSIIEPEGIFDEDRPRPTIDQLYSRRNHPYQEYLP